MSKKVLVIGDVITDVIVRPEGPIVQGSDRRASILRRPGGSGANQAVWLADSGVDVVFAARVGVADKQDHEKHFRAQGVTPMLSGDDELQTGIIVTLLDPYGERSFLTDRGANLNLCVEDLPDSLLDGVGMVLISGYSFFVAGPRQAVQSMLHRARAAGVPIAIDPASVGFLDEVGPQRFREWVGKADWVFANESEAETLTGTADFEQQVRSLGEQFAHVVIKRGQFGAVLGDANGISFTRSAPIVPVLDSTGGGDAFAGGFIAALLEGKSLEICLQRGVENGARAVQFVGGQPQ